MQYTPALLTTLLIAGAGTAHAGSCTLAIESNDMMQYNTTELRVPPGCDEVEVVLHHTGKLPAKVMGHDWVLARSADMSAIINAAMAAGPRAGYLPTGDARILAATSIVGGGESTSVHFQTQALRPGESYSFFCTTPGHATAMKGRLIVPVATASNSNRAEAGTGS